MAEAIIKCTNTKYDKEKLIAIAHKFSGDEIVKQALSMYEKITK